MYRIRLHGRGGQGIRTATQILGSAFFLAGYAVQDAPRFGAERRGAPVFGFVRASRGPIRERGFITRPDLVVVADESLAAMPEAGVTQGATARTVLLIASATDAGHWASRLRYPGEVRCLGPGDRTIPSALAVRCAGAAAALVGLPGGDSLARVVEAEVGRFGPAACAAARRAAIAGYEAMRAHAGRVTEGPAATPDEPGVPEWIDVPHDDVRVAAPAVPRRRIGRDPSRGPTTGLWRTARPVIDERHCHRCTWICGTLCPDGAIATGSDGRPSIDYDHCKGCLVCVAVCPAHAIVAVPEPRADARSTVEAA